MGVCDDGKESRGAADGAAGEAGGGYIRGVQAAGCFKHTVGVCDYWEEARGVANVAAGGAGGGDIKGV